MNSIENSNNTPSPKIKHKFNLICASKVKRLALDYAKENKFHPFTRVSEQFLISCEIAVRQHLEARIKTHPSVGKTLM